MAADGWRQEAALGNSIMGEPQLATSAALGPRTHESPTDMDKGSSAAFEGRDVFMLFWSDPSQVCSSILPSWGSAEQRVKLALSVGRHL